MKTCWVDGFKVIALLVLVSLLPACTLVPEFDSEAQSGAADDSANARQLLVKAVEAADAGNTVLALETFASMEAAGARSPKALNYYAIFLREQWQIEEARRVYRLALKYSPRDKMTHWNLAILCELYLGDFPSAVEHYQAYQRYSGGDNKIVTARVADLQRRIQAGGERS